MLYIHGQPRPRSRARESIKNIKKQLDDESPSIEDEFYSEVFLIVDAIMPSNPMSFVSKAAKANGYEWNKEKDRAKAFTVDITGWSIEAGIRASADPPVKSRLDALAAKYNMKVSTVLPSFKD